MVSPFRIFRKKQKMMLAILIIVAMGGFIVLPTVLQMLGGRTNTNSPVVTTAKYDDIDEDMLRILRGDRGRVLDFLRRIQQVIVLAGGEARAARWLENRIGSTSEQAVVNAWLLAKRAEELGLIVTDDAITAFVNELLENRVTSQQIGMILDSMNLSEETLFRLFRHELLAMRLRDLFRISLDGSPPAQWWDYYQRLNRKVTIEAVSVPVVKYLAEIEDPDEATLREFFDQYKDKHFDPSSPEPGFFVPKKVAFEYFKAEYEELTDAVPEGEVREYYEQHKDEEYKRIKLPDAGAEEADSLGARSGRGSIPELDGGKESLPGLYEDGPYATQLERKPDTASEKPEQPDPAADKPAPPTPSEPSSQRKQDPVESKLPAEQPAAKPDESGKTSSTPARSPFLLASYRQEDSSEAAPAQPEPSTDEPAAASEKSSDKPIKELVDSIVGANDDDQSEAAPSEYLALEEVEDEIRRRLAEAEVKDVLGNLQDKMRQYRNESILYGEESGDDEKHGTHTPPQELDFDDLAKKNGLTAHKTGLISAFEAQQLDIGSSNVEGNVQFTYYAYETLQEYRPTMSQDPEGNYYLSWRVKDAEERIPEFEDEGIKKKVRQAWKMIQARDLAIQEAETLRAEARKAGGPLMQVFGDRSDIVVTETEPFSWLTYGAYPIWMAQTIPRISEIKARVEADQETYDAVEVPGDDFMRSVFNLGKGESGVAMNQPKTAAYVVRVTEVNPSQGVLREEFLGDMKVYARAYALVALSEQIGIDRAWQEEIETAAGLQWQREPRQDLRR